MKQDEIRIILTEKFSKVIINMYITHSMLHWVNCNLILFSEICYEQKLNLHRTDVQGLPARVSLNTQMLKDYIFQSKGGTSN